MSRKVFRSPNLKTFITNPSQGAKPTSARGYQEHKPQYPLNSYQKGHQKDVPPIKIEYNDNDIPRIFITNINKNHNSNDMAYLLEEDEENNSEQLGEVKDYPKRGRQIKLSQQIPKSNQTQTSTSSSTTTTTEKSTKK